jgi:hypothetical protein
MTERRKSTEGEESGEEREQRRSGTTATEKQKGSDPFILNQRLLRCGQLAAFPACNGLWITSTDAFIKKLL